MGSAAVEWVRARVVPGGVAWADLYVETPTGTRRICDEADALAVLASSGGTMPLMRVRWTAWDDALVPAVETVAALARAAGYAGARLRAADLEAVEARYEARLSDTELREARRAWRAAMTAAADEVRRLVATESAPLRAALAPRRVSPPKSTGAKRGHTAAAAAVVVRRRSSTP